jgi:hypothetical protein
MAALLALSAAAANSRSGESAHVTLSVPGRSSTAPWVASAGRFVAVAWGAQADKLSDVYIATSVNEGRTFAAPVRVKAVAGDGRISGEIPPRVALHLATGASRPDVVVAWNAQDGGTAIKIARSRDFGRTFAQPQSLQAPGAPGDRGWHALTVDAEGRAHVVWLDHRGLADTSASASAKGGATGSGHASGEHDGVAMAQKSRLHYATVDSTVDGSPAPAPERRLAPGVCYCCKTALAPTNRGVVAAWRHVYAGNMRDIAYTWLGSPSAADPPARVSEDGWSINGCPDDGPALAVGEDDRVHAVWPTVIPGDEPIGALFYASTPTGATAFSARQRVPTLGAPKPSHPQVAVDGTGRLFFAWDEILSGVRTAATSDAMPGSAGALQFSSPSRLAPSGPTSYPVMAPLTRGVVAAFTSGAPGSSVITVRRLGAAASSTAAR